MALYELTASYHGTNPATGHLSFNLSGPAPIPDACVACWRCAAKALASAFRRRHSCTAKSWSASSSVKGG